MKIILPKKENYSYHLDNQNSAFHINVPNGAFYYVEKFFSADTSHQLMTHFLANENGLDFQKTDGRLFEKEKFSSLQFSNIQWQHNQIKLFGKSIFEPRYTAWYGDEGKSYTYSGTTLQPHTWTERLLFIKSQIETRTDATFNSVLLNWYRDGNDHMGWHTDDEKELGQNPVIASVNLGTARRFVLRRKDHKQEKVEFLLNSGSLLIMKGELQHYWQHCLPKMRKVKGNRINLTFRKII